MAGLCALLAFCLFSGNVSLFAQNKSNPYQVTGTVLTESGEAVIGAGVVVKGTLNGTTTDMDGKFSLKGIPAGTYTIEAWHPQVKSKSSKITVPESGKASVTFSL